MKGTLLLLAAAFAVGCDPAVVPASVDRVETSPGVRFGSKLDRPGATCATSSPQFAFAAVADASHATCWQYDLGYQGLDKWYLQVIKTLHVPCIPTVTDPTCGAPFNDASFVRMCVARWHPKRTVNGIDILPGHTPQSDVEAPCAGATPSQANVTGKNGCAVCADVKVPHP